MISLYVVETSRLMSRMGLMLTIPSPFWLQLALAPRFPIFPFRTNDSGSGTRGAAGGYKLHSYAGMSSPSVPGLCCLVSAPRSALVAGYDAWGRQQERGDRMRRDETRRKGRGAWPVTTCDLWRGKAIGRVVVSQFGGWGREPPRV